MYGIFPQLALTQKTQRKAYSEITLIIFWPCWHVWSWLFLIVPDPFKRRHKEVRPRLTRMKLRHKAPIETGDRLGSSWFSFLRDKFKYTVSPGHTLCYPRSPLTIFLTIFWIFGFFPVSCGELLFPLHIGHFLFVDSCWCLGTWKTWHIFPMLLWRLLIPKSFINLRLSGAHEPMVSWAISTTE